MSETDSGRPCPIDGCGNTALDNISDSDGEYDWFCVWCGNFFRNTEDGLNVQ